MKQALQFSVNILLHGSAIEVLIFWKICREKVSANYEDADK
jgi:hypothetical protein